MSRKFWAALGAAIVIMIAAIALTLGGGSVQAQSTTAGCPGPATASATPVVYFAKTQLEWLERAQVCLSQVQSTQVRLEIWVENAAGTTIQRQYVIPAGQAYVLTDQLTTGRYWIYAIWLPDNGSVKIGDPSELHVGARPGPPTPTPDPCTGSYPPPGCGGKPNHIIFLPLVVR